MDRLEQLRAISTADLAVLGLPKVAYIKQVKQDEDAAESDTGFGIFSADGKPLAVLNSREAAYAAALQNDLAPLSVH